jgi:hypothetical protein
MPQTTQNLIAILHMLAAMTGLLAVFLFRRLRANHPIPVAAAPTTWPARLRLTLLWAPRWSRVSVLVLSGGLALLFAIPLALLEGHAVLPIVDALVAALLSQLRHAFTDLSPDVPAASAGVYTAIQARLDALKDERSQ